MLLNKLKKTIARNNLKTFKVFNFGCRVNSAEINQLSQLMLGLGLTPSPESADIILINTCSITKKGEVESLSKVRTLNQENPKTLIIATGCANLKKIGINSQIITFDNQTKEKLLSELNSVYTHDVNDKFSKSNRFILKIQSGCTAKCSYCIVPSRRPYLWSLPIDSAVTAVSNALKQGYREIIITGVNINQYSFGLANLVETLLINTQVPLISFGSVPILSIDKKFIDLYSHYPNRLHNFLHIPIQSASDKILKNMQRTYNSEKAWSVISEIKNKIPNIKLGTDIIVGFPGETEKDFEQTFNFCRKVGFNKIHTFKFSPRPGTQARGLFEQLPKINNDIKKIRSQKIRSTIIN